MTATRRIIINVLATYGRSLLSMACGIFSSRWILMILGERMVASANAVATKVVEVWTVVGGNPVWAIGQRELTE